MARLLIVVSAAVALAGAQFFDPILDDKSYLDNIEKDVADELVTARTELMEQAKVVENVTKAYIAVKLKENVFRALRAIAEHEMTKMKSIPRQLDYEDYIVRQEEEDDDDDTTQKTTTPLTGLGTAVKVNQQVFSFLGEAFNIIFGGGKPKPKKFVEPAVALLDKPKDVQLLGVVSLLAREEENMPLPEVKMVVGETKTSEKGVKPVFYPGIVVPKKKSNKMGNKHSSEEQEEEDFFDDVTQEARIFDLFNLLGLRKRAPLTEAKKIESLSGFDDVTTKPKRGLLIGLRGGSSGSGSTVQRFDLQKFMKTFKRSMNELQSNVPDIYRGAREAYLLVEKLRSVAERIEEFVEDTF